MRILVSVCAALLALAVGFEVYSSQYPPTALIDFVQSRPLLQKLAWAVIIVAPFVMLAAALWESALLDQQRKANEVWETRFRGVRKAADELEDSQMDVDRAANYLERSDPENAMSLLQQRQGKARRDDREAAPDRTALHRVAELPGRPRKESRRSQGGRSQ